MVEFDQTFLGLTSYGYPGLTHVKIKSGGQLCLLCSCNVLVLLRIEGSHYTPIGSAPRTERPERCLERKGSRRSILGSIRIMRGIEMH